MCLPPHLVCAAPQVRGSGATLTDEPLNVGLPLGQIANEALGCRPRPNVSAIDRARLDSSEKRLEVSRVTVESVGEELSFVGYPLRLS
ncbi:hypothetical protein AB0O34_05045 [Sphaerisporangium sp. NPDC088356]|uniref:hypothetical protein n=1 Tax=Sphaerisporangium sp. NPDC088356 TaxID=3154871 RepID=UPI0034337B88